MPTLMPSRAANLFSNTTITLIAGLALSAGVASALQHVHTQPVLQPAAQPAGEPSRLDANAEISFENTDFDWGNINDIETVNTTFKFTNTGTDDLTIYSGRGSCGCTVPSVLKDGVANTFPVTFQPGQSGEIVVQFDPANRQGDQSKTVTLRTSSAKNPSVVLNLKSLVIPLVVSEPAVVQLLDLDKGVGGVAQLNIWGTMEGFKVLSASSTHEMVRVDVVESGIAEFEGDLKPFSRLAVSVLPDTPIGRFTANMTVVTNDSRRSELTVRLVAGVNPDIIATPNRVPVGRMDPGAVFEQTLTLSSKSGKKFTILDSQVSGRFKFDGEIIEVRPVHPVTAPGQPKPAATDPAAEYTIVVRGIAPDGQRMIRADVILTTDIPDETEVKIPVFGSIRAQPLGEGVIDPNG